MSAPVVDVPSREFVVTCGRWRASGRPWPAFGVIARGRPLFCAWCGVALPVDDGVTAADGHVVQLVEDEQ